MPHSTNQEKKWQLRLKQNSCQTHISWKECLHLESVKPICDVSPTINSFTKAENSQVGTGSDPVHRQSEPSLASLTPRLCSSLTTALL